MNVSIYLYLVESMDQVFHLNAFGWVDDPTFNLPPIRWILGQKFQFISRGSSQLSFVYIHLFESTVQVSIYLPWV